MAEKARGKVHITVKSLLKKLSKIEPLQNGLRFSKKLKKEPSEKRSRTYRRFSARFRRSPRAGARLEMPCHQRFEDFSKGPSFQLSQVELQIRQQLREMLQESQEMTQKSRLVRRAQSDSPAAKKTRTEVHSLKTSAVINMEPIRRRTTSDTDHESSTTCSCSESCPFKLEGESRR